MNRTYEQWKESFIEKVRVSIQVDTTLSDRGEVMVQSFFRANMGPLDGLTMPKLNDSGISPVIYLNEIYESFQSGVPEDVLVSRVTNCFMENSDLSINTDILQDYEAIKDRLRIRVNGYEKNRDWAKQMVSIKDGDFLYSCYLPAFHGENGRASINITKAQADHWGVSYEQMLMDAAIGSMKNEVELRSVWELIGNSLGAAESRDYYARPDLLPEEENMFMLREKTGLYGASVIARKDVLGKVGAILNDDYYVLPSSVDEVLIIPAKRWNDPERLNEMVREINEQEVEPEERLTDHVQFYDRSRERLMNALEYRYQKRTQERMDNGKMVGRKRPSRDDYER